MCIRVQETTTTTKVIHRHEERTVIEQKYSGWTVSNVVPPPGDNEESKGMLKRESRVVEVTEAGVARRPHAVTGGGVTVGTSPMSPHRAQTTLEEELDNLFHTNDYYPQSLSQRDVPMAYRTSPDGVFILPTNLITHVAQARAFTRTRRT
jgi:hypothetical protein